MTMIVFGSRDRFLIILSLTNLETNFTKIGLGLSLFLPIRWLMSMSSGFRFRPGICKFIFFMKIIVVCSAFSGTCSSEFVLSSESFCVIFAYVFTFLSLFQLVLVMLFLFLFVHRFFGSCSLCLFLHILQRSLETILREFHSL